MQYFPIDIVIMTFVILFNRLNPIFRMKSFGSLNHTVGIKLKVFRANFFSLIYRTYISIYGYNTCELFYYYQGRFAVLVT